MSKNASEIEVCDCGDWSTEQAASYLNLQPQTLRKAYSARGSYFGVRPHKAVNGRLFWDVSAICHLVKRGGGNG